MKCPDLVADDLSGFWGVPNREIGMRPEVPRANGGGVMGIRAVQAGALTAAIDRPLPADNPEVRDYERATGFRRIAAELGDDPAVLAHRYALSLAIDTLVLGVENRHELAGCVDAAATG